MISPRLRRPRGDLGPEILRRELLAYAPPCAGRGQVVAEEMTRDGDLTDDHEQETKP
jgi:hypothetical protein